MVVYGLCDTAVTVLGLAVESQMYDSLCVPMPITSTHDNPSPPNLLAKGQNVFARGSQCAGNAHKLWYNWYVLFSLILYLLIFSHAQFHYSHMAHSECSPFCKKSSAHASICLSLDRSLGIPKHSLEKSKPRESFLSGRDQDKGVAMESMHRCTSVSQSTLSTFSSS